MERGQRAHCAQRPRRRALVVIVYQGLLRVLATSLPTKGAGCLLGVSGRMGRVRRGRARARASSGSTAGGAGDAGLHDDTRGLFGQAGREGLLGRANGGPARRAGTGREAPLRRADGGYLHTLGVRGRGFQTDVLQLLEVALPWGVCCPGVLRDRVLWRGGLRDYHQPQATARQDASDGHPTALIAAAVAGDAAAVQRLGEAAALLADRPLGSLQHRLRRGDEATHCTVHVWLGGRVPGQPWGGTPNQPLVQGVQRMPVESSSVG
mmetsp:Transcript_16792/g.46226  ORF Transcript_16792/g.46226 Transcript_16792/m.46226 type:complete len:265 (+) Transcript_16792:1016-1810(+)